MKSVIQESLDTCPYCFNRIQEGCGVWHHIYNGTSNRAKSEADGMKIYIHPIPCHQEIHSSAIKLMGLKAYYQPKWMEIYGKTEEEFIERYGQNFVVRYEEMRRNYTQYD